MGTRCLTDVVDSNGEILMTLYRQFDGYPTGHGEELKLFLGEFKICNGIGREQELGKWANGMSCLAAQIVSHFKKGIGEFYLYPPGKRDVWEEYLYVIKENTNHSLDIDVYTTYGGDNNLIYSGPISEMDTLAMEKE